MPGYYSKLFLIAFVLSKAAISQIPEETAAREDSMIQVTIPKDSLLARAKHPIIAPVV